MNPLPDYIIRECTRSTCRFRFPVERNNKRAFQCPKCGAPADFVAEIPPSPKFPDIKLPQSIILDAILDNLRSTFNVGAIFRTADSVSFRRLHLCGITPTPDHPKVNKTALGAEHTVPWEYHRNSLDAAQMSKEQRAVLWALEYTPQSISLYEAIGDIPSSPVTLVVGNERAGIDPGLLAMCDCVVWIPMHGQKESLNVAVAFSIAAYTLRFARETT